MLSGRSLNSSVNAEASAATVQIRAGEMWMLDPKR